MKFEAYRFVEACRAAIASDDATGAIRAIVSEAVSDPQAIVAALGEPTHAGFSTMYRGPELTILDFAWAPWMTFKPHNHSMWSVIGIVAGREDNLLWRRIDGGDRIEAAGAKSLGTGEAMILGKDIIHSVVNPLARTTRALQIYAGDFFAPVVPRSEWDPETLVERPFDFDDTRQRFADADVRAAATRSR